MFDILIRGGMIVDGTGNPWYRADVGVSDGRIVAIGRLPGKAKKTVRAQSLAVSPGFIDVHTHADGIVDSPSAPNFLRQGVTMVVSGNCGGSEFPVGEWLDRVAAAGPSINYGTLVGHGTLRRHVMGMAGRRPTPKELKEMCRLAAEAMEEGALGISTGLFYVPGAYAELDELVQVSRAVAERGGVYASHKRSAGGKLFEALDEAAAIGKGAGIPIEISHLKVLHRPGRTRKDRMQRALAAIAAHRAEGIEMTCDIHPYPATYTSLSAVAIPPRVSQDGRLNERLQDADYRASIRKEVAGKMAWIGGADKFQIARFEPDPALEGKTVAAVAEMRGVDAVDTAMDLVVEGEPRCIFHALRPEDVAAVVGSPLSMIASDGEVVGSRKGVVHPRNYGTFPRVLREYVRERRLLTLEDAVRKMTSLPARKFGIPERGLLRAGMVADLLVFDPATVGERATFDDPHAFPTGVRRVIVNGRIAWDGRAQSRERHGQVIRRS